MNHQANTPPSQNHTARRPKRQRRPLKAWTRHEVTLQTGDCCTFVNERGERCAEERWLHRHHIVSLSQGGTDEASNITLLCSAHHSLVHQLSLALDGQITWLRSPQAVYLSGPPRHHGRSFGGGPGRADLANRHWSLVAAEME